MALPQSSPLNQEIPVPASVTLERFEYGKFCQSAHGPIEYRTEHQPLGWSTGFPQALVQICDPSFIGRGTSNLPGECTHGTVWLPVIISKEAVYAVWGRVRTRPEAGEGETGRHYTLARYLVARAGRIGPLTGWNEMEALPLTGLTRADVSSLLPCTVFPQASLLQEEAPPAFFHQGLMYLLSGIPLCIPEFIPEKIFFSWVEVLWRALPESLQCLISAAWGVSGSVAAQVMVSFSMEATPYHAQYHPLTETWIPPLLTQILTPDGAHSEQGFSEKRLRPGKILVTNYYPHKVSSVLPKVPDEVAEIATTSPKLTFPTFPSFRDAATMRTFRYVGLKAEDRIRVQQFSRWLSEPQQENTGLDCNLNHLNFTESALHLFPLAAQALSVASVRARGDRILWETLQARASKTLLHSLTLIPQPVKARVDLLVALLQRSFIALEQTFTEAAALGLADTLPQEATQILTQWLDDELARSRSVRFHQTMLVMSQPPQNYLCWVEKNTDALALKMLEQNSTGSSEALQYLSNLQGHILPSLVRALLAQIPPDEALLQQAHEVSEEQRQKLTAYLQSQWHQAFEERAQLRESLLPWLRVFPFPPNGDVLLSLVWKADPFPLNRVLPMVHEIENNAVPPSLLPPVSTLLLQHWQSFEGHVNHTQRVWKTLLAYWPPEVIGALLTKNLELDWQAVPESVTQVVQNMQWESASLTKYLKRWIIAGLEELDPQVPQLLWVWATKSVKSYPLNLADFCRELANGQWVRFVTEESTELDHLVRFITQTDGFAPLSLIAPRLWVEAQTGWQLLLVLKLFPNQDFQPTTRQLIALVPHRQELTKLCANKHRQAQFWWVTKGFHELQFPGDTQMTWTPTLRTTPFWAIFRKVPFEEQGTLVEALEVFGVTLKERAHLCHQYVEGFDTPQERLNALKRVCLEFLFPYFRQQERTVGEVATLFQQTQISLERKETVVTDKKSLWRQLARPFQFGANRSSSSQLLEEWESELLQSIVRYAQPDIPELLQAYAEKKGGHL